MSQSNIVNFSGIAINTANTSNGVTWGYPVNTRAVVDANFVVTVALPGSSTNSVTNALDLGDALSGVPYVTTETINVGVLTTASNNGNAALMTVTLEHTNVAANGAAPYTAGFVTIPTLGSVNIATNAGSTTPASSITFKLPPGTLRYIRSKCTNGTTTLFSDATMTCELLF